MSSSASKDAEAHTTAPEHCTYHAQHHDPATFQSHVVPKALHKLASTTITTLPFSRILSPFRFLIQGLGVKLTLKLIVFLPGLHEYWDHAWLHRSSPWTPELMCMYQTERPRSDTHTKKGECGESNVGTIGPSGLIQQGALRRELAALWLLYLPSVG